MTVANIEKPDSHGIKTAAVVLGALAFLVIVDRGLPGPR